MKHRYYDMVVTKAANMDLVLFVNSKGDGDTKKWKECCGNVLPNSVGDVEYFLCLPQHKEACLHWLNGGEAEKQMHESNWCKLISKSAVAQWHSTSSFMMMNIPIRIKPSTEKRWVVVMTHKSAATVCGNQIHDTKDIAIEFARRHGDIDHLQFIEIEIEI